jgi:hypothetical protein
MNRRIKVLIVEDRSNWSNALKQMYAQTISNIPAIPVITIVDNSADADAALSTDRFDLLSLDINLGEANPSAHWDDLLKLAKASCTAVIIVTGIAHEPEFSQTSLTLNEKAIQIFGARDKIKFFQKPNDDRSTKIDETIQIYQQQLPPSELLRLCDRSDINLWQIFPKAIAASTYILMPTPNAWAESDRFAKVIREMIVRIATIYGQRSEATEDWYEYIMTLDRIARLKWLASICKVAGAFIFTIVGLLNISIPALGVVIGGFCGLLIGGCCGLVIYRRLIIEIGIKSIGHFGRNYTA